MSTKKLSDEIQAAATEATASVGLKLLGAQFQVWADAVRELETRLEQARGYLENEDLTDTVARFMALAVLHGVASERQRKVE